MLAAVLLFVAVTVETLAGDVPSLSSSSARNEFYHARVKEHSGLVYDEYPRFYESGVVLRACCLIDFDADGRLADATHAPRWLDIDERNRNIGHGTATWRGRKVRFSVESDDSATREYKGALRDDGTLYVETWTNTGWAHARIFVPTTQDTPN